MTLTKCPRCELNYILDGEKLCSVCRREVRGEPEQEDMPELCSECGEHAAVPGGDLCIYCLKEMNRRSTTPDDGMVTGEPTIEIDSMSTMDEIELDLNGDDLTGESFDDEDNPLDEDEKEDDGEDENDEDDEDDDQ